MKHAAYQIEPLPPWLLESEEDAAYRLGNAAQIQLVKIHAAANLGKVCHSL